MIVYVELTDLEVTEKGKCSFICHLNLLLAVTFFNGKKYIDKLALKPM